MKQLTKREVKDAPAQRRGGFGRLIRLGVCSVVDHLRLSLFTHFLAIATFGGLPHKRVLRSMELMARHVLPRLGS